MGSDLSRRQFRGGGFSAVVSWALLETLIAHDLLADEISPVTHHGEQE